MSFRSKIRYNSKTGIGIVLIFLPLLLFFLWRSSALNRLALSSAISSELDFWRKTEKQINSTFFNVRPLSLNIGHERDLVVFDTSGKRIFGFGNRYSFSFDKLKNVISATLVTTEQGMFLCYPLRGIVPVGFKGYGLSVVYYAYSDENFYFKSGPSRIIRFLGDVKLSAVPMPEYRYFSMHDLANGFYVKFKNPFQGKEILILIFVTSFLVGIFILVKLYLIGTLREVKAKIFLRNLLPWGFIIVNHLIFLFLEYNEVEFYDKYILIFQNFSISYYELFIHLLILNLYTAGLWMYLRKASCRANELSLYFLNLVLLLVVYSGVLYALILNYDFIRYLSYYASGKFVFFNYLLVALLISGLHGLITCWLLMTQNFRILKSIIPLIILSVFFRYIFKQEFITWLIPGVTILILLFHLLRLYILSVKRSQNLFLVFFMLTLILSLVISLLIYNSLQNHEKHRRFLLLTRLESIETGDPILQNSFMEIAGKIVNDTKIIDAYNKGLNNIGDSLLSNKYFSGIWKQFSLSLTYCTHRDKIRINPSLAEYNCFEYFAGTSGLKTEEFNKPFIFTPVEQGNNIKGYLGYIRLTNGENKDQLSGVFIEFSYANFSPSFCFADVFYNKGIWNASETIGYSFARYSDGKLISHSGAAWFPDRLNYLGAFDKTMDEFAFNQTQYTYLSNIENKTTLIIARSENNLVKFIGISSAISFLAIIFGLFYYLFTHYTVIQIQNLLMLLRVRLQLGILGIVFMVLFVMSLILNDFYVASLVQWTQRDIRDKVHSLSLEIDSRLERSDQVMVDKNLLFQWFLKLSNIYFLDIIYYNSDGVMLISTVPQVEDSRFFNGHLHYNAYKKIILEGLPYYLQEEKLGSFSYYAVYFPVKTNSKIYGVASIPVVSGKPELDNEYRFYSSMMAGLILFMLLISLGSAFLLSGLVVKPLKRLSENISRLKIGMRNEKIEIRRQDEIGELSQMYNNLVDELDSAILELRRKERELAWKDVARQIAHEIKNPLTPIKLQIQFLQSSFNPNDEQWKERFTAFSATLLEKIEELTRLANTFSEIAVWPASHPETTDFTALIRSNVNLSLTGFGGKIDFELPEEPVWVNVDKYQMGRVIDNLVKNARQAISDESRGIITLKLKVEGDEIILSVQDNGTGITPEQKSQIFMPNFTTKSFGMGLGLFISRNIVLSHGGEIEFISEPGQGTTFTVRLPYKRS